jgi:hypothetical protein
MSTPCTEKHAIDFLVENAKRHDEKLDKLIDLQADNKVIRETLKTHGTVLDKIEGRLEVVEARPAKIFKWFLTVTTPVLSAILIYIFVG